MVGAGQVVASRESPLAPIWVCYVSPTEAHDVVLSIVGTIEGKVIHVCTHVTLHTHAYTSIFVSMSVCLFVCTNRHESESFWYKKGCVPMVAYVHLLYNSKYLSSASSEIVEFENHNCL